MNFHDAEIISIEVDRIQHIAKLKLCLVNDQLYLIELVNLKIFRAEDFVMQNVIYEFLRYGKNNFSDQEAERWMKWGSSLSDRDSWINEEKKNEFISACANSELELLVILPSAGAQIVALCERIIISSVSAN